MKAVEKKNELSQNRRMFSDPTKAWEHTGSSKHAFLSDCWAMLPYPTLCSQTVTLISDTLVFRHLESSWNRSGFIVFEPIFHYKSLPFLLSLNIQKWFEMHEKIHRKCKLWKLSILISKLFFCNLISLLLLLLLLIYLTGQELDVYKHVFLLQVHSPVIQSSCSQDM